MTSSCKFIVNKSDFIRNRNNNYAKIVAIRWTLPSRGSRKENREQGKRQERQIKDTNLTDRSKNGIRTVSQPTTPANTVPSDPPKPAVPDQPRN